MTTDTLNLGYAISVLEPRIRQEAEKISRLARYAVGFEQKDVEQELRRMLIRAVENYSGCCAASTFVYSALDNCKMALLRKAKQTCERRPLSLDEMMADDDGREAPRLTLKSYSDPGLRMDEEEFAERLARALTRLSDSERRLVRELMATDSISEACAKAGVEQRHFNERVVPRLRRVLQASGITADYLRSLAAMKEKIMESV